jgi:hypothetical protein
LDPCFQKQSVLKKEINANSFEENFMKKFLTIILALLVCSGAEAVELFENTDFSADVVPWALNWGDELEHTNQDGHSTPFGAAEITGHTNGFSGMIHPCIDVSHLAIGTPFQIEASIRAATLATAPEGGFTIIQYREAGCQSEVDNQQILLEVVAGQWTRVRGDFPLVPRAKSLLIVLFANDTPDGGTALFDDVTLTTSLRNTELIENPDVTDDINGWALNWGSGISHITTDGDLTILGSVQTTGHQSGDAGIRAICLDISMRGALDEYSVAASIKPAADANAPLVAIFIDLFANTNCTGPLGNRVFGQNASAGAWNRITGTLIPSAATKSIRMVLLSRGTQDGGINLYDDFSVTLTNGVRQMWLIGVGSINNKVIQANDMRYTRGGEFGFFDPADITSHPFVDITITFTGCHSGSINFIDVDGSFAKGYSMQRLAANRAGLICDDMGFNNIGENNDWMAGTFFGGPSLDGEGFVIDVLEDGVTAIVTWYGYLPN